MIGVFYKINSCPRLVGMVLLKQHEDWITQTYMDAEKLKELYADDHKIEIVPPKEQRSTVGINPLPPLKPMRELVMI